MDVSLIVEYRLVVSSLELRLISKALRGQLTEDEAVDARALQEKLMLRRAAQARHLLQEFEKAEASIEKVKEQT